MSALSTRTASASSRTTTTRRAQASGTTTAPRLAIKPRALEQPLHSSSEGFEFSDAERQHYEHRIRDLEAQVNDLTLQLSQALRELIDSRQTRQAEVGHLQQQISDLIAANQRMSALATERKGVLERAVRTEVGRELARQLESL